MALVAYTRVSTDSQAESGAGLEAQRHSIEAYAARHGLEVRSWHSDDGVSGAADLADRPALAAAVADLRRGDVLIVAKRDRLGRDTFVVGMIERVIGKRGATVVSADGVANGDTPADQFMRSVLDAASQFERGLIRQRTRSALAAKRRAGEVTGTVPFGWQLASTDRDPSTGDLLDSTLIEVPAEQTILRLIAELRGTGMSLQSIADTLNAARHATKKGRKWHASTIRSVIGRQAALAAAV
jgi:DNA invertase Pin-like site-specific DNA recombinase